MFAETLVVFGEGREGERERDQSVSQSDGGGGALGKEDRIKHEHRKHKSNTNISHTKLNCDLVTHQIIIETLSFTVARNSTKKAIKPSRSYHYNIQAFHICRSKLFLCVFVQN